MAATVEATYSTVQGDGGGIGQTITTGTEVDSGDWLIAATAVNGNATVITAPGTGTWTQITLPDNVITTSGGQIRLWKCPNPADSTAYAWSFTNARQSLVAALIGGADLTDAVDVASSLETGVGTSHTSPTCTPTGTGYLTLDFAFHRQFNPDTTDWTPPSSGLTWTELKDVQGADGNNNVRLAMASATAGTGGVAISTAPWTKTDGFEEGLIVRVVIKSAAGSLTAAQTGRSVLGLTGAGVEQRVAGAGGRTVIGLAGRATEVRRAVEQGRVPLGLTGRGVDLRRAASAGAAVLGLTGRATEAQGTPSETGRGTLALTGAGTAVRVAATGGRAVLGLAGRAVELRRAPSAGRAVLALTGRGSPSQPGPLVGTYTGSTSSASGMLAGGAAATGVISATGSASLFA